MRRGTPITLSVLIPCYNEAATIDRTLDAVLALGDQIAADGITLQIVAVDDASKDATFARLTLKLMHLTNPRFGIEPEIVARLTQMGARVYEVPISYHGRTYAEGKKITWKDGVAAFFHILRARLSSAKQPQLTAE